LVEFTKHAKGTPTLDEQIQERYTF